MFDVLFDNAVRYSRPGSRIELSGSRTAAAVAIAVVDGGVGIAPDGVGRVFDRFYRGAGGGPGLGLAIARHLVEAHEGSITVSSILGIGSRFVVMLPIGAASDLRNEAPAAVAAASSETL